jgi:hypothetical protein
MGGEAMICKPFQKRTTQWMLAAILIISGAIIARIYSRI